MRIHGIGGNCVIFGPDSRMDGIYVIAVCSE